MKEKIVEAAKVGMMRLSARSKDQALVYFRKIKEKAKILDTSHVNGRYLIRYVKSKEGD